MFDVVPKSHQPSAAVKEGGAAPSKAPEGVGLSEQQKVQLLSASSTVINIVCNADSNNTVLVVSSHMWEGSFVDFPRTRKIQLVFPFWANFNLA